MKHGRFAVGVSFLLFTACASTSDIQLSPQDSVPSEKLAELSDRLEQGRERQADWISPDQFAKAQEAYDRAEVNVSAGLADAALKDMEEGFYRLQKVDRLVIERPETLSKVIKERQIALDASAHLLYPNEFEKTDQALRRVGVEDEQGELDPQSSTLAALQSRYAKLGQLAQAQQAKAGTQESSVPSFGQEAGAVGGESAPQN